MFMIFALCWLFRYNSRIRRQEHDVLRQQMELPQPAMTSDVPLPPARTMPDQPLHAGGADHAYCLPPDTAGQAAATRRRRRTASAAAATAAAAATVTAAATAEPAETIIEEPVIETELPLGLSADITATVAVPAPERPKTSAWRHKRNVEKGIAPVYKKRKDSYSCRKCGQPSTKETGHSQYKGYAFCPNQGQTKEEWLAEVQTQIFLKREAQNR